MARQPRSAVRPPAMAGSWYPGEPRALRRDVEGYLDQTKPVSLPGPVLALVSPHAGYAYSGPTAGYAYAQVRGAAYRRVILMGPLHRPLGGARLGAFMATAAAAFATPLGEVPVDEAFMAALDRRVGLTEVSWDNEHSLEIQLPFLQVALPGSFSLAPILLGENIAEPNAVLRLKVLADALADLCSSEPAISTLLVASTDLTHTDNYAEVVRRDGRLVELLDSFDLPGVVSALQAATVQACGAAGLVVSLYAAQRLGARGARVLSRTSSGDVTGDRRPGVYTVGYLAVAVYGAPAIGE